MDPVSIVGLAASVATITDLALVVFVNLNSFYRKVRDAPKKSKELRERLDWLLDQLANLQDALAEEGRAAACSEAAVQDFEKIKNWLRQLQKHTAQQSPHGIIRRLKWPFTERQNEDIIRDIDWMKRIIDLRLGTEQLYDTQPITIAKYINAL
jgi:hypothetical protein